MSRVQLIHPIYLDVPMLVSFAAAVQGGLSYGAEVTKEKGSALSQGLKASAGFGLSNLFSSLFQVSASAEGSRSTSEDDREVTKESRAHTEASIAILLYDQFQREKGYITTPESIDQLQQIEPGALVELHGTILKNAVDTVIDYIDAIDILSGLDPASQAQMHRELGKAQKKGGGGNPLKRMREALDKDRKRTPISNVLLQCSVPPDGRAVVTLRTSNLRDLTLSELHKNSVRVLGKVTRVIGSDESMSAFENYGMALLTPELLQQVFGEIGSQENFAGKFSDVQVAGPAVQVLPLMVFV